MGRGWAGLAPVDNQDDCLVIGEVNQQELFGRVAAVVHHGGAGTTTTAARAACRRWWCLRGVTRSTGLTGSPDSVSALLTTVRDGRGTADRCDDDGEERAL
jgi:vancomycin aglycone glucosyltransferase